MGFPGFPDANFVSEMTGFVTHEDRARWEQKKASSDAELEKARGGLSARGLASQAAKPAMSLAEKTLMSQMHAEQNEERRNTLGKKTKRSFEQYVTEEPVSFDERGPSF